MCSRSAAAAVGCKAGVAVAAEMDEDPFSKNCLQHPLRKCMGVVVAEAGPKVGAPGLLWRQKDLRAPNLKCSVQLLWDNWVTKVSEARAVGSLWLQK